MLFIWAKAAFRFDQNRPTHSFYRKLIWLDGLVQETNNWRCDGKNTSGLFLSLSLWCEIHGGLKTLIFCEGMKSPSLITCLTVVYLTLSLRRRDWQFQIQCKKRLLKQQTLENVLTTCRSKSDTWQFKHDGALHEFNCRKGFHCIHHTMFVLTNTCLSFKGMVHPGIKKSVIIYSF